MTDGKINGFRVNMLVTFVLGGDTSNLTQVLISVLDGTRFVHWSGSRSRRHALT